MPEIVFICTVLAIAVLAEASTRPRTGRTEADRLAERQEMRRQRRGIPPASSCRTPA